MFFPQRLCVLAALLSVSSSELFAQQSPDYAPAIEKLQAAVRYEVEQKNVPAFSIAIVDGKTQVWASGFGFQDADKKVPATAETVYRVGSISKLFTDIAVMQLVEKGKLDLDEPIQTYIPYFKPENPYAIPQTLRQLMTHRSGLVRESPVGNYFDPDEPTLTETVTSLNRTKLVYKPNEKTKYSNAAIAVVGSVLEQQIEESHPNRVRRSIFDVLGMKQSSFVVSPAVEDKLATGWMWTYDDRRFAAPTFLLGTGPAGNLYSNVVDLGKFLSCIFESGRTDHGQILQPDTLKEMLTPGTDSNGDPLSFGIGFHVGELDGHTKIGHGGAVYGFSTQLEALPELKLGVVAMSALDGSNGLVERLANYALRLMVAVRGGKPLPEYRQTTAVPSERIGDLIGKYREVEGERLTHIYELNEKVLMQRGSFRFELRAAADDGSIVTDDVIGYGTKIIRDGAGQLNVGDIQFRRLPAMPPNDIPDRWRGLIGEYGWDHNTLYILEDDGKLYALIEWFYYYPLKEISDDVFAFPDYGLYHGEGLKFKRDSRGIATEVNAAEVVFQRRNVGTLDGETFKITPLKPIDELRGTALSASPPAERGDFRDSDLVELAT
ncbi:MAG: beta-lactamase family protein, partial [Planctomycetales bacterium]|nr:beta-lactamase family protein [Planctomycetales bacterium]